MITLFSTSNGDVTTCKVMDWLRSFKANYQRINLDEISRWDEINFQIGNKKTRFFYQKAKNNIVFHQNGACWFRRGRYSQLNETQKLAGEQINGATDFQHIELDRLIDFIFDQFKHNAWLNHPNNSVINKLKALEQAKQFFTIPHTLITNSKAALIDFLNHHKSVILKPISENREVVYNEDMYVQFTEQLSEDHIKQLDENIFPVLVQENIPKDYEIRSFYLEGEIYSMAIFSQSNIQTQTDVRKYSQNKLNRMVPYKMNKEDTSRIQNFMGEMDLNSGSIDFIKKPNDELVFLEVNPVGQFGMISQQCNYRLEEKVAKVLLQKETKQ